MHLAGVCLIQIAQSGRELGMRFCVRLVELHSVLEVLRWDMKDPGTERDAGPYKPGPIEER